MYQYDGRDPPSGVRRVHREIDVSWRVRRSTFGSVVALTALSVSVVSVPYAQAEVPAEPQIPTRARAVALAIDPVARRAYVVQHSGPDPAFGSVNVLDLATRREIATLPTVGDPASIAASPLTGLVYVANGSADSIAVFHGPTLRPVATVPLDGGPRHLLVEPSIGRLYVALERTHAVAMLDAATLAVLGQVDIGAEPIALDIDRIRNKLYVAGAVPNATGHFVMSIDADHLTPIARTMIEDRPDGLVVFDQIGRIVVPSSVDGSLLILDSDELVAARRVQGFDTPVRGLAVNERRSRLYVAASDPALIVALDPLTGAILGTVETGVRTDAIAADPTTARLYAVSAEPIAVDVVRDPSRPPRDTTNVRIVFEISGGLGGLQDRLTIQPSGQAELLRRGAMTGNTDLGKDRLEELVTMFYEDQFFQLRPRYTTPRPIPDALEFSVTFRDGQREQTVVMSTGGAPPSTLLDIIRRLERVRQELIVPAGYPD